MDAFPNRFGAPPAEPLRPEDARLLRVVLLVVLAIAAVAFAAGFLAGSPAERPVFALRCPTHALER